METQPESWKRMVLRSMPRPSWLSDDAPHVDVVLSSRTRVMRNLAGHRFPNRADAKELQEVMGKVLGAAKEACLDLDAHKGLTNAERDHLVACRMVSPEFPWTLTGRALLIDPNRTLSLMVNEEDHLRVQALTAGYSLDAADTYARVCLRALNSSLEFAWSPKWGYLSASPYNAGTGRRRSAMFHLIGLAQSKRLPAVLQALATQGLTVRGMYGEASRAVGAFVQVSITEADKVAFAGACEYLMREERESRAALGRTTLAERARQARDFAVSSPTLSLADAMRVLAWARWAATAQLDDFAHDVRGVDVALASLELRAVQGEDRASRQRADDLRQLLSA